ncbi:T9SS type A sorting domain-containing protein [Flavobacterium sp.]|uniref:T9SS type A sorting domain-containing protein n=1 Tax=Flavobacterium sp. TaxID=239 RepID=UPI00391D6D8A
MKTKLLSLILITVLFTSISNAQTKVWDFGNDTTTWPLSSGIGINPMVVDNLGLYPIPTNTNFGAVTANSSTFPDGFTSVNRFQMNGAGYPSGPFQAMPTQRYLFVDVSGACTIKVWFRPGSNGAVRTMYVTNGTVAIGQESSNTGANLDPTILTAAVPSAGRYYIYGDTACNLYKVSVVGATVNTTLSNNDFQQSLVNVFSNGKQISVSNVISNTQVDVYSITGALVKSFNTTSDTSFDFYTAGLYIVNVKSAEGQKSVKVAIQ